MPRSETSNTVWAPSANTFSPTSPPSGEYLIALDRKLPKIGCGNFSSYKPSAGADHAVHAGFDDAQNLQPFRFRNPLVVVFQQVLGRQYGGQRRAKFMAGHGDKTSSRHFTGLPARCSRTCQRSGSSRPASRRRTRSASTRDLRPVRERQHLAQRSFPCSPPAFRWP